jgi:FtsP/CotA-like multicopper oxidase with cupredoxin domain
MKNVKFINVLLLLAFLASFVGGGAVEVKAQTPQPPSTDGTAVSQQPITQADRQAAADRAAAEGFTLPTDGTTAAAAMPMDAPHYFSVPNYANSPLPSNPVVEWNAITQGILQPAQMGGMTMTGPSMSTAFVYLAYTQAAVYNALVAIEGGYTPYNSALPAADPAASREAAVAAASYRMLLYFLQRFPNVDTLAILTSKYNSALAAIVDVPANITAGVAVGEAAAAEIIALRTGDGLLAPSTYTVPAPGPGVWEPTVLPNGTVVPPVDPWMKDLTPFLRASASQYRPATAPDMTSVQYATDLNELKAVGGAASIARTPAQTEVALFWTTNMVIQTNAAYRQLAESRGLGLLDTARLMAMGNMVATDSLIFTFDTKYFYNFWRPITAIQRADTDGNALTDPDITWTPAVMTPSFPEYVAGHGSFVSAQAEVYAQFFGTQQIDVDLTSGVTGTTRHYATTTDLRTEIIDARTWGGLHFRSSSQLAVTLGQQLVANALVTYFTPAADRSTHESVSGGIRKFVDTLPGLTAANANNLGQYIPVGTPDTTSYPGSDYYEIAVVEYEEQMHSDLPPTTLRGYVQLSTAVVPGAHVPLFNIDGTAILLPNGSQAFGVDTPHYLGPTIAATSDRPVRILFRNLLPTGSGGNLFIPVDTTVMGSGMGPLADPAMDTDPLNPMCGMNPKPVECYTENRATLHLHGGISPWISDGTPHQWITPANENTPYPKGVSVSNVPDMPDPGPGAMTFFYTNQQSARLMFYHDHAWGITRLNVYAGEAAAYLITDPTEQQLINTGILPADQIPLVIQDKTFVPSDAQLAVSDPLWDTARWGGYGDLWIPHVYVPAQNPGDSSGVNQFGRWAYGPWFWPPTSSISYGPVANPYYDATCNPDFQWCEPPLMPGTPYVSMGMEAFNDTPLVNGTLYPTLSVDPKSYRLRILNAANDRFFNLQLYVAIDAAGNPCTPANLAPVPESTGVTCTEVLLNPAEVAAALGDPTIFPTPDMTTAGPSWIQIGTEGGFLPAPAVIPAQPITWVNDPTVFNAGNVDQHSLLLGPAERADAIVDFSAFAGYTLILYNDAPAAFPARDPRYDYYTGNGDYRDTGGAPSTQAGYGPNTRTVMQIIVANVPAAPTYDLVRLENAFKATSLGGLGVFQNSQNPIIVGQGAYNSAYGTTFQNNGPLAGLVQIFDTQLTFKTLTGATLTMPLTSKAIQDEMGEAFDPEYGRMSGNLGVEVPNAQAGTQQNLILYPFVNPATEIFKGIQLPPGVSVTPIATTSDGTQIWKITHNGVDTHPIHFHLFDVQLINRVGWDGIIRKPDANELGWKDTVRISPLEDTIVAMRPIVPQLPWGLFDSIRPLNPSMPLGSTALFNSTDILGNGIPTITNQLVNFDWEYVWHCHILSHEEMDMMRPMTVDVNTALPTPSTVVYSRNGTLGPVSLTWSDGTPLLFLDADTYDMSNWGDPAAEVGFRVERAEISRSGRIGTYSVITSLLANVTSYVDSTVVNGTNYSYRVIAYNAFGDSTSAAVPNTAITVPAAPTTAAATFVTGKVSLTWRDNASNEDFFMVQRSQDGGAFNLIAFAPARNATGNVTYIDSGVSENHTYQYRVAAVNAAGSSNIASSNFITIAAAPAVPTYLRATFVATSATRANITLSWNDNATTETGFVLERATNAAFTTGLSRVQVAANTITLTQSNLAISGTTSTTFYYRIKAYDADGTSVWSNTLVVFIP